MPHLFSSGSCSMSRQMLWNGNKAVPAQGVTQTWGFSSRRSNTSSGRMHYQLLRGGTTAAVAARRVRNILGSVLGRDGWMWRFHEVKLVSTSSGNLQAGLHFQKAQQWKNQGFCWCLLEIHGPLFASLFYFYTKSWLEFDLVHFWPLWWISWRKKQGQHLS